MTLNPQHEGMPFHSLRTLFELRKSESGSHRLGFGRVFYALGKPGLYDHSGALWPIGVSKNLNDPLVSESHVFFSLTAMTLTHVPTSKYFDFNYQLCIEHIYEQKEPEENSFGDSLVSSLPDFALLQAHLLKVEDGLATQYFSTPLQNHFENLRLRMKFEKCIRNFFVRQDFLEVRTPLLVPSGGYEGYMTPFESEYQDRTGTLWPVQLPTSPEFAMKKLLCQGFPALFQLTQAFRNDGELSPTHEPEFLMLEWYQIGQKIEGLIDQTIKLVAEASRIVGKRRFLEQEFEILDLPDTFQKICGIDLNDVQNPSVFYEKAKRICSDVRETDQWEDIFCKLMMGLVEPEVTKKPAVILQNYPKQLAGLAALNPTHSNFVFRFEMYLDGIEVCNGYQELTDQKELLARFNAASSKNPKIKFDPIFSEAMKFGLPACAGNALGVDRLFMILAKLPSLQDTKGLTFTSQFAKSHTLEWS